jgi:hypothetical protein
MPVGGRKDKLKELIVSIEEVYSLNGNGVPAIRAAICTCSKSLMFAAYFANYTLWEKDAIGRMQDRKTDFMWSGNWSSGA